MNIDLTLTVPPGRVIYPTAPVDVSDPMQPGHIYTYPETPPTPLLLKVSAEGMSVMAVVALLRETADQLDDRRYLEANGETPRPNTYKTGGTIS